MTQNVNTAVSRMFTLSENNKCMNRISMLPLEECPHCCMDAAPGDQLCREHQRIEDDAARQQHVEFMEDE